jgi:outer membrane protein assembly factor BamB
MATKPIPKRWPLLVITSLLLGGCSWFTWLPWVDDKTAVEVSTDPFPLVKFEEEVDLDRLWRASVGDGLGKKYLRLSPAVVADRVVAADGYGNVEAFDRFKGKSVWQVNFHELDRGFFDALNFMDRRDPSFVSGGVGIGGGMVLIGTTFGELIALSAADGSMVWRAPVDTEIVSVPSVGDGLVFAQSINGRLMALDAETGEIVWSYDNQVPVLTLRGTSSPVFDAGVVYTGFANGKVIALRASNGEPIWEHRVMLPEGRSELERMVDVDSSPLVKGPSVYAAAYQGRIKNLSRRDGGPRWEHDISTHLDLAEGYDQVYVVDDNDVVHAIDQNSGEIVWTQESFKYRQLTPPTAFSNYIVFGDAEGYLHVIAQRDGRLLGRRKIDGDGIRSGIALADGTLYVLGNSGKLNAIDIQLR